MTLPKRYSIVCMYFYSEATIKNQMAQKSKREFIIAQALPLFLDNGFKATSIDLVVKQCGVSKPTVYNHFPDKVALIAAVIEYWVEINQPDLRVIKTKKAFERVIQTRWLTDEAIGFYALVIGEGRRFPVARQYFWARYDENWRGALIATFDQSLHALDYPVELIIDQQLLSRLKQL